MNAPARIVWLLAGGAWATRSILEFAEPDYWNAVTALDFAAVWLSSACWLILAPAVILIGRLSPSHPPRTTAVVVAGAAVLAGVANGIEDGLGVSSWGSFYVLGTMTAWLGILALVVIFARAGRSRLGWVAGGLFTGFLLFNVGGGLLILGALAGLAINPRWFVSADRAMLVADRPGT